jgi:proteasome accessory factor A
MTAIELQSAYLEEVKRHAARGVFEGVVPRASEIVSLWEDTLVKMARGDLMSLAPRLDWIRKLATVERALEQWPRLDWQSPETKIIDHMYSSLSDEGLYRTYEANGMMERLVSEEEIARFTTDPPPDTRAWTRAMLLRRAREENVEVDVVDWDRITFKMPGWKGWPVYRTVFLDDPLGFTEGAAASLFDRRNSFTELIEALESLGQDNSRPALWATRWTENRRDLYVDSSKTE